MAGLGLKVVPSSSEMPREDYQDVRQGQLENDDRAEEGESVNDRQEGQGGEGGGLKSAKCWARFSSVFFYITLL